MKKIIFGIFITLVLGHDTHYKHIHHYPSFLKRQAEWTQSVRKHNSFYNKDSYRYWRTKYEDVMKDMNELHIHYDKLIKEHNYMNQSYKDLRKENTELRLKIKRFECYDRK